MPGSLDAPEGYADRRRMTVINRKALKPGDWIEVRDPNKRVSYGAGGAGVYKVVKVGRVNVTASIDVRFSPTGPWHHQEHTIPLAHVVRVIPPNEFEPHMGEKAMAKDKNPLNELATRCVGDDDDPNLYFITDAQGDTVAVFVDPHEALPYAQEHAMVLEDRHTGILWDPEYPNDVPDLDGEEDDEDEDEED